MLYDSHNVYWLSWHWLYLPLATGCMGVPTEELSATRRTLCGASQHIIIPSVLFGLAEN
jgi:hypothetical protein